MTVGGNGTRPADTLLAARVGDMLRVAERGECAVSPFLTPQERVRTERQLARAGVTESAVFWGGYTGAERRRLYLLPSYLLSVPELLPPQDTDPVTNPAGVVGREDAVAAVRIEGSGFRELTHRDYLGSLLSLGLERDVLGDIAVQDAHTAVVFCTARVAEFLPGALERVASDRVRCRIYLPDADFTDGRRTVPVSDTVASPRLDCVVAALTGKSRESAREAITDGLVEVDYLTEERPDRSLTPPVMLSVRGVGKFRLLPFGGETKKGRLRLMAEKFV